MSNQNALFDDNNNETIVCESSTTPGETVLPKVNPVTGALLIEIDPLSLANKADLVDGKVPSSQLPSYVDDVVEYAGVPSFPITGETGKIYVDTTSNIAYRWTGLSYVAIGGSGLPGHSIQSGPSTFTQRTWLDIFSTSSVAGVSVEDNGPGDQTIVKVGYLVVEKDGVFTTQAITGFNFTGAGVTLSTDSSDITCPNKLVVHIPTALEIPQNIMSANYELVLSDSGKHIYHPVSDITARALTIPANSVTPFPIGTAITVVNRSAGAVTIGITTDTLIWDGTGATGSRILALNGKATLLKETATSWSINGSNLT